MKKTTMSEAIAARMNVLAGIPLVEEGGPEKPAIAADYEEENLGDPAWNDGSDEDLSDTELEAQGMHIEDPDVICPYCGDETGECECSEDEYGDDHTHFDPGDESEEDRMADLIDAGQQYVRSGPVDYPVESEPVRGRTMGFKMESKKIKMTEAQLRNLIRVLRG
jgi:hypothetical protein